MAGKITIVRDRIQFEGCIDDSKTSRESAVAAGAWEAATESAIRGHGWEAEARAGHGKDTCRHDIFVEVGTLRICCDRHGPRSFERLTPAQARFAGLAVEIALAADEEGWEAAQSAVV